MADHDSAIGTAEDLSTFEDGSRSYSKNGPERTSAPIDDPLRDILETLYSEHRYLFSLLDTLELQAARLQPGKVPDYHLLLEIVDYLTHYPDQYHHPREDLLFRRMLQSDRKFGRILDRLEREHKTLHYFTHELFKELTGITAGRAADRPALLRRIERYSDGYRKHMTYENRQVFPRVKGTLTTTDLDDIREKTRFIDDPLFGGEVQFHYRRLGRKLQARVEVASQQLIAREMSGIETLIERLSGWVETLDRVKTTANRRGRDNWREQLDTVKAHTRLNNGPGVTSLPAALLRNHLRHLNEGVGEMRQILKRPPTTHDRSTGDDG